MPARKALAATYFAERGFKPFPFQRKAWKAFRDGESGLIHAPTGMGKTFAALFGPLQEWAATGDVRAATPPPIRLLWITPLRSLATDLAKALREPVEALGLPWTVDVRTGDTPSGRKRKQLETLPTLLVTTPESLSILLSYGGTFEQLRGLRSVVVDEWHELVGNKRGVQTELGLARLRRWAPELRTWGVSATIGNLEQAMDVLLGADAPTGTLVRDRSKKTIEIDTLFPSEVERFPWAGHLGIKLLPEVLLALEGARTTLVFTGTRSQAESWARRIKDARPEWEETVALHHGSLDPKERKRVEEGLKAGELRGVVCTSSLDLGVDFTPVDQVIQIGSPHGVGRLIQRAGRSGHRPGVPSRVTAVPTHAMELVEFAAARNAIREADVEERTPLRLPLDVLAQHMVTIAAAGGFVEEELKAEVRTTHAFADLSDEAWDWTLGFTMHGGDSLRAYARYHRIRRDGGRLVIAGDDVAKFHRMAIGTITSDQALEVRFANGKRLGTIEEMFVAKLQPGETFVFAGQRLKLVGVKGNVAKVKVAKGGKGRVPAWHGGRSPLSSQLAAQIVRKLRDAAEGKFRDPELAAVRPLLELQARRSALPDGETLLLEQVDTEDGFSVFAYPFQGRLVHEGIAALVAHRLTSRDERSIVATVNDYGIEWASPVPLELEPDEWRALLSPDRLVEDLLECLNTGVLARRQFRDIARIAGLIFQGYPGQAKRSKQLQASSELLFDMFTRYDPENLLLSQARREVLERQLDVDRLRQALTDIEERRLVFRELDELSRFHSRYGSRRCARSTSARNRGVRGSSGSSSAWRSRPMASGSDGSATTNGALLEWGGETFALLPELAVWWEARRTLILADPHFGKSATFRAAGMPVPRGITRNDTERMASLVRNFAAERLLILGDFFHAARGRSDEILRELASWRDRHAELDVVLVRGNHDRHAGDPPAEWRFTCVSEPFVDDGLAFNHFPEAAPDAWSMAGHVHPGVRLDDAAGASVRLPCYHASGRCLVVPAFGTFTGLHRVSPSPGRPDLRGSSRRGPRDSHAPDPPPLPPPSQVPGPHPRTGTGTASKQITKGDRHRHKQKTPTPMRVSWGFAFVTVTVTVMEASQMGNAGAITPAF